MVFFPKWSLVSIAGLILLLPSLLIGQSPSIVISEYINSPSTNPLTPEWIELLVIEDNLSIVNYQLRDNNSSQLSWQPAVTFKNVALWRHLRAGNIIIVWSRLPSSWVADKDKVDGYIEVTADDASLFSYGSGSSINSASLVIAKDADLLQILNGSAGHVHALGHTRPPLPAAGSWSTTPNPRLNYNGFLSSNMTISVCPGSSLDDYGSVTPQYDSVYVTRSYGTFGLPNVRASSSSSNAGFWCALREPEWVNPTLSVTSNSDYSQFTLTWNSCMDNYSSDNTTGYLILRSSDGLFSDPIDGYSYTVGSLIGSAVVVSVINSSIITTYTDSSPLSCGDSYYYRVVPFRFVDDQRGVVNIGRGRAYNQTSMATAVIQREEPNTGSIWSED